MPNYSDSSEKPACPGCRERDRRISDLEGRVRDLERRLDEALRAGKRQAAPFSKGPPKGEAKRCGRKPGDGRGWQNRETPQEVDETLEAPLPHRCEHCGGEIEEEGVLVRHQTDIPPVRPVVTRINVHTGRCLSCGRRAQGRHPRQTSTALGAAAHTIGPNALAPAAHLQKVGGLSHGKIARFFEAAFTFLLPRSTLVRGILRMSRRLEPAYRRMGSLVRRDRAVSCDETGWRVGGHMEWLWAFATRRFRFYVIRGSRGFAVAAEVLTPDYGGALVHDGWAPYDKFERATHQTCLAHLLRRARLLLEDATRGAVRFPRAVQGILQQALALRDRRDYGEIGPRGLAVAAGRLGAHLERLGTWRLSHEGNRKFRRHILAHLDQVLVFLRRRGVEATNWRAEQAIRPAVVNRKVWGGNRTPEGAHAQEVLMSVFHSCALQRLDAIGLCREVMRLSPDSRILPAWAALGP